MLWEAIKRVHEAELDAQERRADALQSAKLRLADTERRGRGLVEEARREANASALAAMEQAEREAARQVDTVLTQARASCAKLQEEARGRLDQAAAEIVRKVGEL